MAWVAARRRSYALLWVTAAVVAFDQVTKHWAVNSLDDGHVVDVAWTLEFALSFNSGMAFSTGQQWGSVIGAVALTAAVVISIAVARVSSTVMAAGLALVAGGAFGNVVDRLFREEAWLRGQVVDFVDFQWFPAFNVADAAVTIGGFTVVVATWLEGSREERRRAEDAR